MNVFEILVWGVLGVEVAVESFFHFPPRLRKVRDGAMEFERMWFLCVGLSSGHGE